MPQSRLYEQYRAGRYGNTTPTPQPTVPTPIYSPPSESDEQFDSNTNILPPAQTSGSRLYDAYKARQQSVASPPTVPTAWQRIKELGTGLYDAGSTIVKSGFDPVAAARKMGMDSLTAAAENPNYKTEYGMPKFLAETAGIPVSNLQEDWRTGAWGAGAIDLAQTAGTLWGAKEGLSALRKPKPTIVPDVTMPDGFTEIPKKNVATWDFNKDPGPVTDPYSLPRNQGIQRVSPGVPGELSLPKVEPPSYVPNERGFFEVPKKTVEPWKLGVKGEEPAGQVTSSRSDVPAKTKVIKVKYRDKNGKLRIRKQEVLATVGDASEQATHGRTYKGKKYGGKTISGEIVSGDFLSDDPLYATVPDRLRPEAPNVGMLRTLSEGAGKTSEVPKREVGSRTTRGGKFTFIDEAEHNANIEAARQAEAVKAPDVEVPGESIGKTPPPELKGGRGVTGIRRWMNKNPTIAAPLVKWMNERAASTHIGAKTVDAFRDTVGKIPKEDIVKFQKDIEAGNHPEVRKFFDDIHQKMRAAGIDVDYKYNYLPQLWEESAQVVKDRLGEKSLSTKAPFTYKSVFEDYARGIEAKLTPKMDPLQLMKWYAERSNKLIADHNVWNDLKSKGLIQLEGAKGTEGMRTLDSDLLRPGWGTKDSTSGGIPVKRGVKYVAPKQIKYALENYLSNPTEGFFDKLGRISGRMTGVALSGGVPETPILQFHGINTLVNAVLEGGLKRGLTAVKAGLPHFDKHFDNYFKANRDVTIQAVRDGLNIKSFDYTHMPAFEGAKNIVTKGINKIDSIQNTYFKKPLFEQMIPKIMIEAYKDKVSKGMSGAAAAEEINRAYGHINMDTMFRDKQFQNVAKSFLFAPAWVESRAKMLNLAKKGNQKAAGRALVAYTAANMVNKGASGHFMWDNDPGHEFDVWAGKRQDGSTRYISLSNALDQYKVPLELGSDLVKGASIQEVADLAKNKTSVPGRIALDFLGTGTDRQGNTLITRSKDKFGNYVPLGRRLANSAADLSTTVAPPAIKAGINLLSEGDKEKAVAELMQAPMRYRYGTNKPFSLTMPMPKGSELPVLGKRPSKGPR